MCMFSIEIQTAGQIRMKFGTEGVFACVKVWGGGGGLTWYPPPPGYRVHKGGMGGLWSLNCAFWRKLYRTKIAGHP